MFLSNSSALCCPSQLIWEYSRVISALFLREMSLSRFKWKGVGKTHEIKTKYERFSGGIRLPD